MQFLLPDGSVCISIIMLIDTSDVKIAVEQVVKVGSCESIPFSRYRFFR